MIKHKLNQCLSIALLGFISLSSTLVLARDVATEQYVVTAAQKDYDNAKADYDATTVMVNDQKNRIAQDQAILKEREKKQAEAKAKLVKAQALLDKRQKELNDAWNKGGH
jgi:septal ring factor EnvC (AmiA/AmiB activator)